MSAFGYVRVSTDQQKDNSSPVTQLRKINAVADYHGWSLIQTFEDLGISGSVPLAVRPGGQKLWRYLERGDKLIVASLDRAFRDAADALNTAQDMKDRGIDLVVADISVEPVGSDGVGKLFFSILASVAEFERERTAARVQSGRIAKRIKGGYLGGHPPVGYIVRGRGADAKLVPDPRAQQIMAHMVVLRQQGMASRTIQKEVRDLYDYNISHVTINKMLGPVE